MPDHVTYLDAKRGLDDRSLSRTVLARLASCLPDAPTVLEAGAGTLTMVERLVDWGLVDAGEWVAVDRHEAALAAGRRRLEERPDAEVTDDGDGVRIGDVAVEIVAGDVFGVTASVDHRFDLLVGCAFFDLVDPASALAALPPADLVYAPVTYDGRTAFEPGDPEDDAVLDRYRTHMERYREGGPDGAANLRRALGRILADGPSPWVVSPPYRSGERVVVERVLDAVESAVEETGYDAGAWASRRRAQLDAGRLRYEADNRDLLGVPPGLTARRRGPASPR